jgi:putative inorganic carbon (HCO3(-)) transporter
VSKKKKLKTSSPSNDWLQIWIVFLFHLLIITVPFLFTWVNDELFEFPKMLLVYGFFVLIGGSWLARMIAHKKIIFKRTFLDWPILLFLGSQILATVFSIHPQTSVWGYYSRFHGGLASTLAYITLYYAFVSNIHKKNLKSIFITFFAAALGVSLYAIPEHFGHSPSCLLITGQFNVDCWIQDVQHRIFGTFGQPNWLAAYTITLFPVGVSQFLNNVFQTKKIKDLFKPLPIFYWITSILLFATLLFTGSRSGFLGLALGGVIYLIGLFLLISKTKAKLLQKNWFKITITLITPLILILGIFGSPYTPSFKDLLNSSAPAGTTPEDTPTPPTDRLSEGGTDSGEIRMIVWEGALNIWKRYPIFGSGAETFAYSYYQDRPQAHNMVSEWDFLYNKAHNEFLNYLATTGVVGLSAYLILLGSIMVLGIKNCRYILHHKPAKHKDDYLLNLGIISGLIALSISNFFGFSTVVVSLLMWLFAAALSIDENKNSSAPSELNTTQYLTLAVVGVLTLWGVTKVYQIWRADYLYAQGKNYSRSGYISTSIPYLQEAIEISPNQALYYDELANNYSHAAVLIAKQGEATQAAQVAQAAIANSDKALSLNDVHLNFYKTRARIFLRMAVLDPQLLVLAEQTLQESISRSPTDAKLYYNLAIVEDSLEKTDLAKETLEKALELKPDYGDAKNKLEELEIDN